MKILAVCKGNRARSPMFEHLLRQAIEQKKIVNLQVESAAGLKEASGKEPEEGAVLALKGIGIDISSHRSRFIGDLDLSKFNSVYCMDPSVMTIVHENLALQGVSIPVVLVSEPSGIPNPYGKDQDAYQLALEVVQREVSRAMSEEFFPR